MFAKACVECRNVTYSPEHEKQPVEGVWQKIWPKKLCKIHRKTLAVFYDKIKGDIPAIALNRNTDTYVFT